VSINIVYTYLFIINYLSY